MNIPMLVGIALALATVALARTSGFERRTFYAAVTLVVGSYYLLFAVMAGEWRVLASESAIALVFVLLTVFGFKRNTSVIAMSLALHALLDATHSALITNTGTPAWWPPFCLAYDLTAAAALAWQIGRARVSRATTLT